MDAAAGERAQDLLGRRRVAQPCCATDEWHDRRTYEQRDGRPPIWNIDRGRVTAAQLLMHRQRAPAQADVALLTSCMRARGRTQASSTRKQVPSLPLVMRSSP